MRPVRETRQQGLDTCRQEPEDIAEWLAGAAAEAIEHVMGTRP
jgi:hypothetical protein